jgi:hypothetical protein
MRTPLSLSGFLRIATTSQRQDDAKERQLGVILRAKLMTKVKDQAGRGRTRYHN